MEPKWKGREQEYQKDYMRDYRQRQTDLKETEGQLTTLLTWDAIQKTEGNIEELAKMKADPKYTPPLEQVTVNFQPLPEHLQPLLNRLTASDPKRRDHVHSVLSHFYYDMSWAERSEAALKATVNIQESKARELSRNSKEAQFALTMMQFKKGIGFGSSEKIEDFEARLERFSWCAKQLKEQGFGWYVASEACGHAYLWPNDFVTIDEVMQRGLCDKQSGMYCYLPSNKFWSLGGNFKKRPFVERPGDLDWMREWALSEREECVASEEKDRQFFKNNYDRAKAGEKVQINAEDLFKTEKLSAEEVFERLKPKKDALLDDIDLESFIGVTKKRVEKEETERIFQDEKVEQVLTEQVTESKVAFTNFKVTVKAIVKDEDEVKK